MVEDIVSLVSIIRNHSAIKLDRSVSFIAEYRTPCEIIIEGATTPS